jgi:hypothetical protein
MNRKSSVMQGVSMLSKASICFITEQCIVSLVAGDLDAAVRM